MNANIKNNDKESRVKIIVSRSFGTQNIIEIYSDYVAKKIRDKIRIKKEDDEKKKK